VFFFFPFPPSSQILQLCNHQSITQQLKKHRQTKANSWFLNHLHQHTHIHTQTHKTSPQTSNLFFFFFFFLTHQNPQFASLLRKHRFKPKPNRFNQKQIETYRIQQTDFRQTDLFLYPFFGFFWTSSSGVWIDWFLSTRYTSTTIITIPNPVQLEQEGTFFFTLQQKNHELKKKKSIAIKLLFNFFFFSSSFFFEFCLQCFHFCTF
jgi:hypothetical protein